MSLYTNHGRRHSTPLSSLSSLPSLPSLSSRSSCCPRCASASSCACAPSRTTGKVIHLFRPRYLSPTSNLSHSYLMCSLEAVTLCHSSAHDVHVRYTMMVCMLRHACASFAFSAFVSNMANFTYTPKWVPWALARFGYVVCIGMCGMI